MAVCGFAGIIPYLVAKKTSGGLLTLRRSAPIPVLLVSCISAGTLAASPGLPP